MVVVNFHDFGNIGDFGCGVNLIATHLLIYSMAAVYLALFIAYSDLIILYFLKREMEERIGFLLLRKKVVGSADQAPCIPAPPDLPGAVDDHQLPAG